MTETANARDIGMVADPDRGSRVLSPLRRRMLEALAEPHSATGLARRLGITRQRANYHLRALEDGGFAELVETRQRRGCTERILRATRRAWVLSPRVVGKLGRPADEIRDRFSSAWLAAEAARMAADVTTLAAGAEAAGEKLATFALSAEARFASPAAFRAFLSEVEKAVVRALARHGAGGDDATARAFRVLVGACPEITKDEEAGE